MEISIYVFAGVTSLLFLVIIILLYKLKILKNKTFSIESKLNAVINHSKDWIYWIAPDKTFRFISPACYEITGYTSEEFKNNFQLLEKIIYEEDRDRFIKHESESLQGKDLNELEFRIITKNNEIKWIHHLCHSIYNAENKYLGHMVSNRDITKLKKTQNDLAETTDKLKSTNKLLEEIIEQRTMEINTFMVQCPYPRAVYDNKGFLLNSNPAWEDLFGRHSVIDNLLESQIIKYGKLENELRKVFKTGERFKSYPIYNEETDRMLVFDFYSIKNKNGVIEKIVCSVEDITEQIITKELTEELAVRKDVLGEMFDFLDTERKHISQELHDRIGQNLLLIKMLAELQKESDVTDPQKIDEIINLTRKTSREIKEIIYSLYPIEIEKYGLIESVQHMVAKFSKVTDIKFEVKYSGKTFDLDKKYKLAIFRVSQEALNNIIKYSDATKVSLEYHFKPELIFGSITDNGKGFVLSNDSRRNEKPKFGLKYIRERIESIGGQIEIHSEVNKGTSIFFEIPTQNKEL